MILPAFTFEQYTDYVDLLKQKIAIDYKEDVVDDVEGIRKEIFEHYTKDVDTSDKQAMMRICAEYTGDSIFHTGQLATAESAARHGDDVWFYHFDYCVPEGLGALRDALPYIGTCLEKAKAMM